MADLFLYKETVAPLDERSPMVNKKVYFIQDKNNGTYSGQIQFDTSAFANSGQWLAYSEGYIEIPFTVTMQSVADITADVNPFILGLKNGYYQLIDSIQVSYNNTTVVGVQPFTNFYINYKLMTSMSRDSLQKWGPGMGFWPDSAGSYVFDDVAGEEGDGYSNNRNGEYVQIDSTDAGLFPEGVQATATRYYLWDQLRFSQPETFNKGFYTRQQKTTAFDGYNGVPTITDANANAIGKNYFTNNGRAGANRAYTWVILAQIRLKDMTDFFDKLPLVKGAFMNIQINYNSCQFGILTSAIAFSDTNPTSADMELLRNDMLSGRTNPVLLSAAGASNAFFDAAYTTDNVLAFECGVRTNSLLLNGAGNQINLGAINTCRLYVPAYSINPEYEMSLLSLSNRVIKYDDIWNFNFTNMPAGGSFDQMINNGIVNPKYIVIIPFPNSSDGVFFSYNGPVYTSPFDTAPGTTGCMAAISNFQVVVAGTNMFQTDFVYDFETFNFETASVNALNGGITDLTNGLIGQYEWDNAYRYYVCDISRRIPAEDAVPKSITVRGQNATAVPMDYYCFVVYERKIMIDMTSSKLIP